MEVQHWQIIIDVVIAVCGSALGWFVRVVWSAIGELKDDLKETNKLIHENLVRKDDYRVDMAEVKAMLHRVLDMLERKQDKEHV